MTTDFPDKPDRRSALRRVIGAGAMSVGLPILSRVLGGDGALISAAEAAANVGGQREQGDLVFIPAKDARTSTIAEWEDTKAPTGPYRIAASKAALERAPKEACRYEATDFNFPTGSLRILKFPKGGPVTHMITFETEILVLQGTATLSPLLGKPGGGKPVKISAGDALFMPSGNITNPKLAEDLVLLTALVGTASKNAKGSIVFAKDAPVAESASWQVDGKEFNAAKPEELKKAPKNASRLALKRYAFDGNSIRVATYKKGGRTNNFNNTRGDVLIYVPKGHFRRKEGDQTFELRAGDATREKMGNAGFWEVLEDGSVFIATDAPMTPAMPPPADT